MNRKEVHAVERHDGSPLFPEAPFLAACFSDVNPPAGKGLASASEIASIEHPRLVNSAYFSPKTGGKLMTTCIDNRVRVWDYLHSLDKPCDREIVHSHDFNRYLTPFRAEWDPKDPHERLLVVGRSVGLHWCILCMRL